MTQSIMMTITKKRPPISWPVREEPRIQEIKRQLSRWKISKRSASRQIICLFLCSLLCAATMRSYAVLASPINRISSRFILCNYTRHVLFLFRIRLVPKKSSYAAISGWLTLYSLCRSLMSLLLAEDINEMKYKADTVLFQLLDSNMCLKGPSLC